MSAIAAAVLFAIALLLHVSGQALGPLDTTFFMLAGLIAAALRHKAVREERARSADPDPAVEASTREASTLSAPQGSAPRIRGERLVTGV